jgi:hypothetical protein
MSATFRVLDGAARVKLPDGNVITVGAPWEMTDVTFNPGKAQEESFLAAVKSAMANDLAAPAMGAADIMPSADARGAQVEGTIEIEAVGSPVQFTHYADVESAHPDETFGKPSPQTVVTLGPGESRMYEVTHGNAWTVALDFA